MAATKKSTVKQKPTAQQRAQAKARAGGNNPIIVTNKGLKKLGKAAVFAASMTPTGRAVKVASMVGKARAGQQVSSKVAKKIGDKISGATSKKVQSKLNKIANKDAEQTAKYNPDLDAYGAYVWSKHPAMVSGKGFNKAVNKGKTVTDRQSVRYRKAEDKAAAKANTRGLKAANKPTKASKTFIGDNKKVSVEYRRDLLKNREKPARANRTRLGKNAFPSK